MIRSSVSRLMAACLAAWFAVVSVDLPSLHACRMHGAVQSMASMAVGHAGDATPATSGAHHRTPADGHATQHVCSCLGHCSAGARSLPPTTSDLRLAIALIAPARSTGRPDHDYVASWVDFVLPFGTAPPASAAA